MQLVLKREQGSKGMMNKSVTFIITARADLTEEEKHNVEKYKLGDETIYNSETTKKHLEAGRATASAAGKLARIAMASMSLRVTVNSLMNGQQITCSSLEEAADAEDAVRGACEYLKQYLDVAATFDGSQEIVEF